MFMRPVSEDDCLMRDDAEAAGSPLSSLIRPKLEQNRMTLADLAKRIGVHASQLSRALGREPRPLSAEKLEALAEALGIPVGLVLQAGGRPHLASSASLRLGDVVPLAYEELQLTVLVDANYVDSALLWWIASKQPFKSVGVRCKVEHVPWRTIPESLATADYAIAVFNKKIAPQRPAHAIESGNGEISEPTNLAKELIAVCQWADLCLYTGYSLLGHRDQLPDDLREKDRFDLEDAKRILRHLKSDEQTVEAIAMAESTVKRLRTPLSRELLADIAIQVVSDADRAVQLFKQRRAKLFIGSVVQRIALRDEDRQFVEILHSGNDPFLASIVSLFASKKLVWERRHLVKTMAALWYEMVRNMRQNREYCENVSREIFTLASTELEKVSYTENAVREVLEDAAKPFTELDLGASEYSSRLEFLLDRPAALVDPLLQLMRIAAKQAISLDTRDFMTAFWTDLSLDPIIRDTTLQTAPP